jgi:hypothetical protein
VPHLITFETSQFDPAGEKENPINPIAGQAVLQWLRKELTGKYELSNPEPEDWGWCSTTKTPEAEESPRISFQEQKVMALGNMHGDG